MNQQQCQNCIYFCRHYIPCSGGFIPVEYGQCIYGPTKMCRACRTACSHFHPRNEDT